MMNWVPESTKLAGDTVELLPLQTEHFDELAALAAEPAIWKHIPRDMSSRDKVLKTLAEAINAREKGMQYPFVIYHKPGKKLVGATRLMNIEQDHRKLEIGWTWLHPEYWATAINLECKLLLLTFCFEVLNACRVQLKTDENNIRSRTAILKTGARFEGILRHDMIREDGTNRNTAYYSITNDEWPTAKVSLQRRYYAKKDKTV